LEWNDALISIAIVLPIRSTAFSACSWDDHDKKMQAVRTVGFDRDDLPIEADGFLADQFDAGSPPTPMFVEC
jgi:hypothetical protein